MNDTNPMTRRTILGGLTGIAAAGLTGIGTAGADDLSTTVAAPDIINCAGWNARRPTSAVGIVGHRPSKIIVHHTVTGNTSDHSKAQAKRHARQVQNIHMDSNGWKDTGYLFLVSRGGFITEGRHRSLEMLRGGKRFVEGAHTSGHNTTGFGVALEGSYHLDKPLTAKQWKALVHLCAFACQKYGIAPRKIHGHRDFGSTACPGDRMYRRLAELRKAVADRL
jgi:hypothetical protein